jgi:hypothetical protein
MMRLALDEAAFRDLVAGRVVRLTVSGSMVREMLRATAGIPEQVPVELILVDIGWARMLCAIDEAIVAQRNRALEADQETPR